MSKKLYLLLLVLLLNAAYLYSFDSPSMFYVGNVLGHLGLGLLFLGMGAGYLRRNWRLFSRTGLAAVAILGLSGLLGLVIVFTGASTPYRWILQTHILAAVLGTMLLGIDLALRGSRYQPLVVTAAVALLFPAGVRAWYHFNPPEANFIRNPVEDVPVRMEEEGMGKGSPFFPSSARTDVGHTIPSNFFMKPESCADSGCHPDIYQQWQSSAHRFSSFNNQWYRKSIEYMQDVVGTEPSKWCGGCHDHAVFFNGMMDKPIREQLERPEAHAGLTCTSCHSIVSVGSTMGNGDFVIEYPPLHDLATSDNRLIKMVHDFVVKVDPGPHKKTFLKPFFQKQTAEYCSSCHKVHLDIPVNNYRWIRGFNDYDGWQLSGVSGQGARSFYYPKEPKRCIDCHMPLVPSEDAGNHDGFVHSHRFPGANTALPFVNGDEEQLKVVTDFLKADQVGVDIFAISEVTEQDEDAPAVPAVDQGPQLASTFAEDEGSLGFTQGRGTGYTEARTVIAPIDQVAPYVRRGETVRVDVVVRTKGIGHFFPGGTVDAFDVWVELKAEDETGRVLFWSGYVPEDEQGRKGPVDSGAHFYRSFLLDENGNHINKRNAWAARSVLYVRLIPPGAADTIHYRVTIPEDAGDQIRLTAKVNYRKFSWYNTQWAYAGVPDPADPTASVTAGYDDRRFVFTGDTSNVSGRLKEIPDLPIVTMAEKTAQLRVAPAGADLPEQTSVQRREDLIRWNDYGIGLLLQGDLKAAEEIFKRVTEIDPTYVDGWVNIGRVRVQEGRTAEAQEVLKQALSLDSELAKTHYFLGLTYKQQGEYALALSHFRSAEQRYPRDRVVLNQIGRILFLQRQYAESVSTLNRVLEIDPEDVQAHYNLMLAYRGLGNTEMAQREQQLYLRFKADEKAQEITGPFRREFPEHNNERQSIHEHEGVPLDQIRPATPARRQMTEGGPSGGGRSQK